MLYQSEKTALITGSSVRVGKYIATMLAQDGWNIALHYNSSITEALELEKHLRNITNIKLFQLDLSQESEYVNLLEKINQDLGLISLLINNASVYKNDNVTNLTPDSLNESLNIHLKAPLYLSQAIAKQKIEANIINIIDAEIAHISHKFFSYSLSKKALLDLTKMLAFNLAPNVRVNAIAPGPILFKEGQVLEIFNGLIEKSPLKKKIELSDLYSAITFLINTHSITGQCIFLDGGIHLQ